MARRYSSFLLRCWHLPSGACRIAVEHIQSGARTRAASLAAAVGWMDSQTADQATTLDARNMERPSHGELQSDQVAPPSDDQ
jgi:hypothetical protein